MTTYSVIPALFQRCKLDFLAKVCICLFHILSLHSRDAQRENNRRERMVWSNWLCLLPQLPLVPLLSLGLYIYTYTYVSTSDSSDTSSSCDSSCGRDIINQMKTMSYSAVKAKNTKHILEFGKDIQPTSAKKTKHF